MIKVLAQVTHHSRACSLRQQFTPSELTCKPNGNSWPSQPKTAQITSQLGFATSHCSLHRASAVSRGHLRLALVQNQYPHSLRCQGGKPRRQLWAAQALPATAAFGSAGSSRQVSVKRIAGSGDCLFAAIAQGHRYLTHGSFMRPPEERTAAAHLRKAVCAELVRQKEMMEPFIGPVEPYARSMNQQGVWGGEPELAMASRCLKRRIHVFQPDVAGLQAIAKYGEDFHPETDPVTLLYNGINHYDLMLLD